MHSIFRAALFRVRVCSLYHGVGLLDSGGLLVPVGCPVLSVWPWRAVLSCFVLSCLFSPGGLLIPPHFPREILRGGGGSKSSGCRGRAEGTEAKAQKSICHGLLSSLHRHGFQSSSSAMVSVCSALEVPVLCSCPCLS